MLLPSILGFAHNSIYYCFSFYSIIFAIKIKHFIPKSGSADFPTIVKNPVFMRLPRLIHILKKCLLRLTHFYLTVFIQKFFFLLFLPTLHPVGVPSCPGHDAGFWVLFLLLHNTLSNFLPSTLLKSSRITPVISAL